MIKCKVVLKHKIDQVLDESAQPNYQDLDLLQRIEIHQEMIDKAYKELEDNFFIFVNFTIKNGGIIDIRKGDQALDYYFFPSQFIIKIPEELFEKIKNHSSVERAEVI